MHVVVVESADELLINSVLSNVTFSRQSVLLFIS